jgi:KDO2-lipid IV(A) lauroyltransferase
MWMKRLSWLLSRSNILRYRILPPLLYTVLYRLIGYRKTIVTSNIQAAFPDLSGKEHRALIKGFYKYLSNLLPEAIAVHEMSAKQVENSVQLEGFEEVDSFLKRGQNVLLVTSHYHNWELCGQAMVLKYPTQSHTLYMPLKNAKMETYFRSRRERFGIETIPASEAKVRLPELFSQEKGQMVVFIGDQSPKPSRAYWLNFLGRETGFFKGFEHYGRTYGLPVFYLDIQETALGQYSMTARMLCKNVSDLKEGEAVCKFAAALESQIKKDPSAWLWSHNRWKHKKPENQSLINCP